MRSFLDAKSMAKALRAQLAQKSIQLSHSDCLELVARQFGVGDWNTLAARIGDVSPETARLTMPKDWMMTGSVVDGSTHRLGLDPGLPGAALIESLAIRGEEIDLTDKIAVLMQSVDARSYRGQRLGLTADLKTEDADAGTIWLRIDGSKVPGQRFDNLMKRTTNGPLRGTRDWATRTIVLDVPDDAESVHYGFFLKGYGKVWARSFRLETVAGDAAPIVLNCHYMAEPNNLDFSQR